MKINGNQRMTGGYDIDDVQLEFARGFLDYIGGRFSRSIPFEEFTDYNVGKFLGVPDSQGQMLLNDFYLAGGLGKLTPVPGALEALKHLSRFADAYALTARDCAHKIVTERTLHEHFGKHGVSFNELHFCFNHHAKCGTERKADAAVRLKLDYMVDDSPENASEIAAKGIPVFLMRRPWNGRVFEQDNIILCADWNEVVSGIEKLRNSKK